MIQWYFLSIDFLLYFSVLARILPISGDLEAISFTLGFLFDPKTRVNVWKGRKKRNRYISQISNKTIPNLLKRDLKKDDPNIAWFSDVSEFRYNRKRLYLSVIQALYNGEV